MMVKNFLVLGFLGLSGCAQAGWSGYYKIYPDTTVDKYIANSSINAKTITFKNKKEIWIYLPRDCSSFRIAGFFTPITPPIPLFWFRSWSTAGKNDEGMCHYFIAETRPKTKMLLKAIDPETNELKIFDPREVEGLYGYTKYIFPIRAKNLDSGTLIIEKDREKIEVPFEYKYFKFWR